MIVTLKLVLSIENDPANMQDNLLLKEAVCKKLKGLRVQERGLTIHIKDAGVYGSGLSSECEGSGFGMHKT